jgi:hypothetical protein
VAYWKRRIRTYDAVHCCEGNRVRGPRTRRVCEWIAQTCSLSRQRTAFCVVLEYVCRCLKAFFPSRLVGVRHSALADTPSSVRYHAHHKQVPFHVELGVIHALHDFTLSRGS